MERKVTKEIHKEIYERPMVSIEELDMCIASAHGQWAYGVVVSMFDFHCSDRGSNPGRGSKIS